MSDGVEWGGVQCGQQKGRMHLGSIFEARHAFCRTIGLNSFYVCGYLFKMAFEMFVVVESQLHVTSETQAAIYHR